MKKLLVLFLVGLFCISLVSAGAFDFNKKSFDKSVGEYGKVTINDWFGFGKQAEFQLTENTEICKGGKCSALIPEFIKYEDGVLIEDIRFIGDQPKSYQIYLNDKPYEIGTEGKADNYKFELKGNLGILKETDWQIKVDGIWITEYALWRTEDGLFVYYDFQEDAAADTLLKDLQDGAVWNGTLTDMTPASDWLSGASCKLNGCLDFDGSNDEVNVGNINQDVYSISMWFNPDDAITTSSTKDQFILFGPSWSGIKLGASSGGLANEIIQIQSHAGTWNSGWCQVGGSVSADTWHHLVMNWNVTLDGYDFILDGVSKPTCVNENPSPMNINNLIIAQGEGNFWDGIFDEIGIWNRTLTTDEILDLWNNGGGITFGAKFVVTLNSPENNFVSPTQKVTFNATGSSGVIVNGSLWTNHTGVFERHNTTIGLSGASEELVYTLDLEGDGNFLWNYQFCNDNDECFFGNSNITVSVDSTAPLITINSPTAELDYGYVGKNETLNWSIIEAGTLDSVWYNHNSSNITVYGASNVSNFSIESYINNNITVYANDSANNIGSTFYEWNYTLFENSKTYPTTTFETDTEYFIINLTYDDSIYLSMNGNLNHNGTNSVLTDTGSGSNVIFNSTIVIPVVTASGTMDFFWNVSLNDGATTTYITSPTYSHSVTALQSINITNTACPAGYFETANYTFKDANNLTDQNMSIDYNFEYGTGDSSSKELYGNFVDTDIFRICINETQGDYKLGYGEINYDSTGYVERRFYMFEEFPLSNETGNAYTLYNLPTASATSFIFEVKDAQLTPYNNKYLNLLRWYPELDEYKIVEAAYTDGDGKTVMKVKVEDVDYRVGVYERDGTLIQLAAAVRMACLVNPCTYTLQVDSAETDFFSVYDVDLLSYDQI